MKNEPTLNVFIIEDNALYASALKQFLFNQFAKSNFRFTIQSFKTSESCMEWLDYFDDVKPDIIVLDYFLDSNLGYSINGLSALFPLKHLNPKLKAIFLSGQPTIEIAVEAMRMGAYEYIEKNDLAFQKVWATIQNCLDESKQRDKYLIKNKQSSWV